MIIELIAMNGYGLYVWSSFSIVFISCALFYAKTKKTLSKYENDFLMELQNLSEEDRKKALETSKVAQQLLATNSKMN